MAGVFQPEVAHAPLDHRANAGCRRAALAYVETDHLLPQEREREVARRIRGLFDEAETESNVKESI